MQHFVHPTSRYYNRILCLQSCPSSSSLGSSKYMDDVGFPIQHLRRPIRSLRLSQEIPRKFLPPWRLHVPSSQRVCSDNSLLEAYAIGTVVTFYDSTIVLEALLITVGLFLGLTLFTLQSKWDFSGMGPFLFGGLWALILAGLVMLFFPHKGFSP